jgi:hypothetical protein
VAAAGLLGPIPIGAAIVLREAFPRSGGGELGSGGIEALVAVLVVASLGPVLTHATARAIRLAERGTLEPRAAERRAP